MRPSVPVVDNMLLYTSEFVKRGDHMLLDAALPTPPPQKKDDAQGNTDRY